MSCIARTVDDQRWDAHSGQDVSDVDVHCHSMDVQRCTRTRAVPHDVDEPVAEALVADGRRIATLEDAVEVLARAPSRLEIGEFLLPLLLGASPRIVG